MTLTAPRSITLSANVVRSRSGLHRCPIYSDIEIFLGDDSIALLRKAIGGDYNPDQAMRLFKQDYHNTKGKLRQFHYTFRGNQMRGILKHII